MYQIFASKNKYLLQILRNNHEKCKVIIIVKLNTLIIYLLQILSNNHEKCLKNNNNRESK